MNKKKWIIVFSIIICSTIMAFLLYFFFLKNLLLETKIELVSDLQIEINSEVELYSFISNIEELNLKTENYKIDTSNLGEQNISLIYLNHKKEYEFTFQIKIIDTIPPEIECSDEILSSINEKIDLLNEIKVSDNSKEEVSYFIDGEYDITKEGEYILKVVALDSSNNKSEKNFTLKVVKNAYNYPKIPEPSGNKLYIGNTNNGKEIYKIDGSFYIDGYLIVNKTYPLADGFIPQNTYKNANNISSQCASCINKTAYEAWLDMKNDAAVLGLNIWIQSGYRPYIQQVKLYNQYIERDGKNKADTYSSRPGHSEHQSGLSFDLNTITDSFANTMEGRWVNENAHHYGFIIRFPKGKENKTGYKYESWHLRYVGTELSNQLYNNGDWISLEEYFGISSNYTN